MNNQEHNTKAKMVYCPELDLTFTSQASCSRYFHVSSTAVQQCLKNEYKLHSEFTLESTCSVKGRLVQVSKRRASRMIPVMCPELKKSFRSCKAAARYFQVKSESVLYALHHPGYKLLDKYSIKRIDITSFQEDDV